MGVESAVHSMIGLAVGEVEQVVQRVGSLVTREAGWVARMTEGVARMVELVARKTDSVVGRAVHKVGFGMSEHTVAAQEANPIVQGTVQRGALRFGTKLLGKEFPRAKANTRY